jgi:pimeloyl-ACP methyl ester carboxylesterase
MAGPSAEPGESELVVDGVRVYQRTTGGDGIPTVFVHGNPTHSADWVPFMRALAGPALAPDLPGWGRSERADPRRFDFSLNGLGGFVTRWLDAAGVGEYKLVCHDWGSVALIAAQQHPERVRGIVLINAVPLLPGYRWHWIARWFWRRRGAGELFNAAATKPALRLISRQATATPGPMPTEFVDAVWEQRRPGTWPQQLALYRSADPAALVAAGSRLGTLDCPALVVWGLEDPYIPASFARAYARALPRAELLEVEGASHWPWIDRPEIVAPVVDFVERADEVVA